MTDKPDAKTVLNPQWPGGMTMDELIQVLAPVGIPCAHCGRLDLHDGMCPIPFMQQASRQLAASEARVEALEQVLPDRKFQFGWDGTLPVKYGFCYFCGQSHEIGHTGTCPVAALAAAPNAPLDATLAASPLQDAKRDPRQGLGDDSSLEHDCLAGTGWAKEEAGDGA